MPTTTRSLIDLPADVLALCIDRSSPSYYVDVRNAVRACRAFRCAVPDMAALIADCRAAQARAISKAADDLGGALAHSVVASLFTLCDGALRFYVPPPHWIEPPTRSERRVVWFEFPTMSPQQLWSQADVVKPLIVDYEMVAASADVVDHIWSDLAGYTSGGDSSAVSFCGDLIRIFRVRRVDGADERWHVSSKVWDTDVTHSLLSYLIALAVEVCCPAAERMPYLHGLVKSIGT